MDDDREPIRRATAAVRPAVLAAVVALAAIVVFAPSLGGDWIYDDRPLIFGNVHVHSFAWWKRWFATDFWDVNEEVKRFGMRMIYWRPAVSASYALDWEVGGGSPVVFHVTNLVWHAFGSVMAFVALRRWVGALVPAFLAALLFALHPTKAESVAWIAGRTDVLCLAMILIASEGAARRIRDDRRGILLEIVGTVGAYLVKEQAIVLFAFVGVEAWAVLGRPAIDFATARRVARASLVQLAVALAYLAARAKWMPVRPPGSVRLPPTDHVQAVFETIGRYMVLIFAPHDLSVQQALVRTEGGHLLFTRGYVVLGALSLIAMGALAWAMRRRLPAVTVGIALFVVTVTPTSNIVNTSMMTLISERFLYLPLIGIALAVGGALAALLERTERTGRTERTERTKRKWARGARGARIAATAAAIALSAVAVRRADDFADERKFWLREFRLHPESLEALRYVINRAVDRKHFQQALELTQAAQHTAARWYAHTGFEADFIEQGTELLVRQIPDHDVDDLRAVEGFFGQLTDPRASSARLAVRDLRIEVPVGRGAIGKRLAALRSRLTTTRAEIVSRLGDDPHAVALAEEAVDSCPGCAQIGGVAAIIEARAGRYERGRAILDAIAARTNEGEVAEKRALLRKAELAAQQAATSNGPVRLQLRARELTTLEAWGRAYDVLAPYKEQIKSAPGFAYAFAELAWRAGEPAAAREVLAVAIPAEKIDATLLDWSRKMGWIDPA